MTVVIDGSPLTIDEVVAVAHGRADVEVGNGLADRMIPALQVVRSEVANDEVVYGVTTGFGALANTRIFGDDATHFQMDLLRSHAGAVGALL
ncbi:MAG: aromatic amino acid lyase, partial [Acidobacteria bacterium]|nr:aromatic amino acid lyase [Acidobacteriota bacterium]